MHQGDTPQTLWPPQTATNPWPALGVNLNGFHQTATCVRRIHSNPGNRGQTKQSLFIPTHNMVDAPQLAQLFLTHVFSKHSAPGHVTSNCRTGFVSHFFRSLGSLLSMKLHFTSGYHPEGNSQTEWINQVLEQYLQAYMNYQQDNWALLLPLVEFTYNNAVSTTTGISPFFETKGYHLRLLTDLL